jgi:hypothetical protein
VIQQHRALFPVLGAESAVMGLRIRALGTADAPLLWQYLRLSIFVRPGDPLTPPDAVDHPAVACYVEQWGRYGDDGVLAAPACWTRCSTARRSVTGPSR